MHERLSKGLTICFAANLLFVASGLVCFFFHITYESGSVMTRVLETAAYTVETAGFAAFIFGDYLIAVSARLRRAMKTALSAYILLEAAMMVLELNSFRFAFYKPYSLPLAIVHSIFSAFVCFAMLQLDPDNTKFETLIIICVGVIFGGMLGNIIGVRIYFSIITNAVGYAVLFIGIKRLMNRDEMEVDCYGDRATVAEYSSSTIFTDTDNSGKSK